MEASMDDQANQNDGQTPPQLPVTEYQSQGGHGEEEEESIKEEDELIAKAQKLMEKITSEPDNPKVSVLHALASILEKQEARYMDDNGHSSSSNARASHNVGRLGSLIRENDEFFELISSKFLSETRYTTSVQAAAARLLMSCSLTWIYPHVFEESVLENIRHWVMDENVRSSTEPNLRHNTGRKQSSDSEMLKTYSTGLLAVCLDGGGQVVEDVLTSGLSAKLMRYLRLRVLGETSSSHKDISHLTESRHASGSTSMKVRDDGRGKFRQVLEPSHLDDTRMVDERSIDDRTLERDQDRSTSGPIYAEDSWDDGQPSDGLGDGADMCEVDAYGEDRWHVRDSRDGRIKFGDLDENARDDSSRRRGNHGWARSRGKGRVNEGPVDSEQVLLSPNGASQLVQGRSIRTVLRSGDVRKVPDSKKAPVRVASGASVLARDDNDDCFQDCQIGSKDICDLVRKAVRAAEAEARAANAPDEAVKAAGDAAAEVVKTAALEELKSTNDEAAAVAAASRAALTVIDAASAIEVLRSSSSISAEAENSSAKETEYSEDVEDYYIPDSQSVARLREKYCIHCLEMLGEYVEVLGPVLHEKGVDVCLALLQQNSKHLESSKIALLLPDVMKLICALSAHRRFAELFVNRGGMQKLLAVPRMPQTFLGISSCLLTIGSLQGIMERVCAPPSDVAYHVVELALQLLELKSQDQAQARKNAALFFGAAFVFRAVIDAFDAQDGLQKLLSHLNDAASVRSGMNAGALGLSNSGSLRNGDRSPAEVLTSSEKQIAYHTCVALRQYFRAHLLLLMDSIRPYKTNRSAARNIPSVRAANKPLDISNEAMDAVFLQLQKDRKLGPAFVRTRWPVVEKFLAYNGHITMLELCQAPPGERYLHDLLQYALGVLHIITLVPSSRRMIVNATLSNNCVGIAVILDAANIASSHVDPEIIQPALNVLVNLVCPPPSISNKPPVITQVQQFASGQSSNVPSFEARDRTVEHNLPDRASHVSNQTDPRERNGESGVVDRGSAAVVSAQSINCNPQTPIAAASSGLVGDRRISLGAGAGCAGLAAQLEQGYRQAREAVRANNGIKVLLHLLQPRIYSPPTALDCLRALACRVLLGLARDNTIAHILTKLQVGKKLSELIRDSGSQTPGTEQGRWQAELNQAAIELIGIVTNSGRASTLVATDAATPTLRRIERAAIAAATPITYHSRELLLLIHEHLQASGLSQAATTLLKEAQLSPLPSLVAPSSLAQQSTPQEATSIQLQWPSGRTPSGFYTSKLKLKARDDTCMKSDSAMSSKKRILTFSSSFGSHPRHQPIDSQKSSLRKGLSIGKDSLENTSLFQSSSDPSMKQSIDADSQYKTPIILPMKRKLSELKDIGVFSSSGKRLNAGDLGLRSPICATPSAFHKSSQQTDAIGCCTPNSNHRSQQGRCAGDSLDDSLCSSSNLGLVTASSLVMNDGQPNNPERLTLDSLVVQYLKHQHRQCPAPITTLPPLSLLHPHVCPEPKRSLDAPSNVTARLGTREFKYTYGGVHGNRRDRQFVFSRFKPWRTCRDDDNGSLLTCVAFLGDSSHIAVGSHNGELQIFDSNSNIVVESFTGHQYPLTLIQSFVSGATQLLLSSSPHEVRLWDASISVGPAHSFEACKAARFSNYGNVFAALSSESARREILLYDIKTRQLESKLSDTFANLTGRGHVYSQIHFNPSDSMLLWNGVLWDRRVSGSVHRFDQFTDYGGGGFHPAGNEVIINSEVWDLRKFRLLRSVPSLDQTAITFNARGDVIYAILRRNIEDVMSAVHTRRVKHPLFAAFRTLDAVNYSDIATIPVDRCVLDFATEPTDSFVGLITMDDQDEMFASARIYDIGRRRPTDDDSDPDDAESEEEEDEDDVDEDTLLGTSLGGDSESDADMINNDHHDDSASELDDDDDGDFVMDDIDFTGERGILEIVTEEDEDDDDDDSQALESLSSGEDDFTGNGFGF